MTNNPTGGDGASAWSPDGEKIAFSGGDFNIFTMNADGGDKVSLTRGPAVDFRVRLQPLPNGNCHDRRH